MHNINHIMQRLEQYQPVGTHIQSGRFITYDFSYGEDSNYAYRERHAVDFTKVIENFKYTETKIAQLEKTCAQLSETNKSLVQQMTELQQTIEQHTSAPIELTQQIDSLTAKLTQLQQYIMNTTGYFMKILTSSKNEKPDFPPV